MEKIEKTDQPLLLEKSFGGADPIPQILPRVGLDVPGNGTMYNKNALDWMKACGINVVCNAFSAVKRQPGGLQYVIDITDITESADDTDDPVSGEVTACEYVTSPTTTKSWNSSKKSRNISTCFLIHPLSKQGS